MTTVSQILMNWTAQRTQEYQGRN